MRNIASDKEGNLLDVYLSDIKDQAAAEIFFRQAEVTTGVIPSLPCHLFFPALL